MAKPKTNSPKKAAQIFEQVMKLSFSGNPAPKPKPELIPVTGENLLKAKFIKIVDEKTGIAHYLKGQEDVWFNGIMARSKKSPISEIRKMLNK